MVFHEFHEKVSTKCCVVRDKDAKWCFTCNNEITVECKSRMILSIRKLLIDWGKACVRFVCILKGVEKFSVRLGGGLELTKFSSFEVVRNGVNVGSETAECICDNVCFSSLMFDFEVVCLDREDPTNDTISSRGG